MPGVLPTPFKFTVPQLQYGGIGATLAVGFGLTVNESVRFCVHVPLVPVIVKTISEGGITSCTESAALPNAYTGEEDQE